MESTPPTRRRWFQFGLGRLFVVVVVIAIAFSYRFTAIGQRRLARRWIEEHGGGVPEYAAALAINKSEYRIPIWREWLGDETAPVVILPENPLKEDEDWIRRQFPEAQIIVIGRK